MGLFNILKKTSTAEICKEDPSTHSQTTKSTKSSKSSKSKSTHTSSKKKPCKAPCSKTSTNIKAAQCLMHRFQNYPSDEDMMKLFLSEESEMVPEDNPPVPANAVAGVVRGVHDSFPDVQFTYKSIIPDGEDNVTIEGIKVFGTHTGKPYSMVPGVFPPIQATGKYIENDEESFYLTMVDGKIQTLQILSYGKVTGPAGLYEQIGGSLIPPS